MNTLTEELPFEVLPRTWQPVANAAALRSGKVMACTLLDRRLALARFANGTLLAANAACPHKGFDLSRSGICDGALQCAYHGWRFDASGACVNIPSLLNPPANKLELSHLRTYPVQERYGMIWVRLEEPEIAPLPEIPELENSEWTYKVATPLKFQSGYRREIENFVDMTHFAFAHHSTLGAAASPVVPPMEIEEYPDGFFMEAPFPALDTPHEAPGKLQQAHRRRVRCHLPNFTAIRQTFEDGDERVLVHVPSPNTRFECTVFWSLAISPNFEGPEADWQMEFATRVLEEDRLMCENQIPPEVPINPEKGGWGVLVTPGDTVANTFQKTFRRWLLKNAPL